jgi:D-psicose/D-tagatose/L-ribulose 3-epimerase
VRLAVSNIAWDRAEEGEVAARLSAAGVRQVEIAPTRAWDRPLEATRTEVGAYRRWWADRDFEIVALQSLNYGRPDLALFDTATRRAEMLAYLEGIVRLGGALGARVFVFGSPRSRLVGERAPAEAYAIAVDFFRRLGDTALDVGGCLCIEPNPVVYGADFVTDTRSGVDLTAAVNHPGFGLHLDAAGLTLAGDDPAQAVRAALPFLRHFHISAPHLAEVGPGQVRHEVLARELADGGYAATVSIEMRPGDAGTNPDRVERAVRFAASVYPVDGPGGS